MIAGIVLAAGESLRMGSPKMLLPWRGRSVVEAVVAHLREGGLDKILVVVGGGREGVEQALAEARVGFVFNPAFARGEMLSSIQAGLSAMDDETEAAMLTPGDLPGIHPATIRSLMEAMAAAPGTICVPAYGGRRGHPVLVPRAYWPALLALGEGDSLRGFLRAHEGEITRVEVPDPGIHTDLDTPSDYQKAAKQVD